MPELGESVHEGTVTRWLKKVGEPVKEDEPVVEIMTDKVNTELYAPATGILARILIPEGGSVAVFQPMGIIAQEGEEIGAVAPQTSSSTESKAPDTVETADATVRREAEERRWFSPVVRAMMKEHGISEEEAASIAGTGSGGRVTKKDLEAYLTRRTAAAPSGPPVAPAETSTPSIPTVRVSPAPQAPPVGTPAPAPIAAGPDQEVVPLVGMRKMIAEAMVRSAAIPTVSTLAEVDVTAMVRFRERNKDAFAEQYGVKLTYTPFFVKAVTEALLEFPLLNASLQDDQIVMNRRVHMGIAVALGAKGDEGLIVPVLRDCDRKGLIEIARELDSIAARARNNQLSVSDVQGGTFTLTNPGSYGAVLGTPMINAPQAAILGTYAIKQMPVIVDGMIAIRSVMNLVLTYDHRLVDGLLAGRFLQSIKARLEAFEFFR